MTTVTAWLSVSATGVRTLYLGADSQGTSLQTGRAVSLREKKVFDSTFTPEIFALSGDLQWGQHFLRRLLVEIGRGSFRSSIGTQKRAQEFCASACANPPEAPICALEILYGARGDAEMNAGFQMYRLRHTGSVSLGWKVDPVGNNGLSGETSSLVYCSGLGGVANKNRQKWISEGDQGNVARTSFWSLCDLVNGIPSNSFMTGGYPQLVKLDQHGCGKAIGVKFNGIPTVYGSIPTVYGRRTTNPQSFANFWVDQNFIQLDPETLEKYSQAQRYGRDVSGR